MGHCGIDVHIKPLRDGFMRCLVGYLPGDKPSVDPSSASNAGFEISS
jgi:hypothetical protein